VGVCSGTVTAQLHTPTPALPRQRGREQQASGETDQKGENNHASP
jgi:hypothetical protein